MNTFDDQPKTPTPHRKHWARRTHRVVAISSLVFLIVITLSGLILNHADDLGLSQRYASSALVKRLYGFEALPIDAAFEAGGMTFATVDGTLYADGTPLANDVGKLRGAVRSNDVFVVATDREWLVIANTAQLIERSTDVSPRQPIKLGNDGSRIVVELQSGFLEFDPEQMSLSERGSPGNSISWSKPATLDNELARRIGNTAVGQSLTWERFLSDLHSGRILPRAGRYIADIAALCVLYLCLSGTLLWFRRR